MQTNHAAANRFNERYKLWREDKTKDDSVLFESLSTEEQIRILQDVKLEDDVDVLESDNNNNDNTDNNNHKPPPNINMNNSARGADSNVVPSSTASQNPNIAAAPKMEQQIRNDGQRITSSTDEEDSDTSMPKHKAKPTASNHVLNDCASEDGSFGAGKVRFLQQTSESNRHAENEHISGHNVENAHISACGKHGSIKKSLVSNMTLSPTL